MAYLPSEHQVRKMVRQAMQDRAPLMFRELEASGGLEAAINQRVTIYSETLAVAHNASMLKVLTQPEALPYEETVGRLEQGQVAAREAALAAALEFPPEELEQST